MLHHNTSCYIMLHHVSGIRVWKHVQIYCVPDLAISPWLKNGKRLTVCPLVSRRIWSLHVVPFNFGHTKG